MRKYRFWILFFAVLSFVAILFCTIIGISDRNQLDQARKTAVDSDNVYRIGTENKYRQALYSICDSMKNIDADLSKVAVSNNNANNVKLLANVTVHANNVSQKLSELPFEYSNNLMSAEKFVNQTQDYATYLMGALANGNQLTAEQRKALAGLDDTAERFALVLNNVASSGSISENVSVGGTVSVEQFDNVSNEVFGYEKLIYDGPFSDSIEHKTITLGTVVTVDQARKTVTDNFGTAKYSCTMKGENSMYVFDVENGRVLVTLDGRIAEYDNYEEKFGGANVHDEDYCMNKAETFAKKLGYNVKPVWVSNNGSSAVTYVNLAPVIDGVVVYPDLIKIAVDSSDGKIVGLEARAYLINHTQRNVTMGSVTLSQAQKQLGDKLVVDNTALALIEKDNKEYVCHEFTCHVDDRQYFVYVDTVTGNEVDIFKVIEGTEGKTVM